ncbi:HTH_Tnp_Tc3_2 domain-containing protein [Trichonephila clavipes]|nr:HTH_Tnp_Tc3_2 domain-containing protein [Trichonephila clavipes]
MTESMLYVAVSYQEDIEIIICKKVEFLSLISEKYNISMENIVLYDYETESPHPVLSVNSIRDGTLVCLVDRSKCQIRVFHGFQVIAVCDASGVEPVLVGGRNEDLLCFLMKAGSALIPVMAVCWSEGGQGKAYNQTVYGLDTMNLHLESRTGEKFPMKVVIPIS